MRVALLGRPNVGKSTLFNRLIGARQAVVSSLRGTTRDRLYGRLTWRGVPMTLIDTGGFEQGVDDADRQAVQRHIHRALEEADQLLLVCDAQEGVVPADAELAGRLRATGKPLLLVVNKADHQPAVPPEFFSLGISPAYPISALHGLGIGELLDHLAARSPPPLRGAPSTAQEAAGPLCAVSIVGRPNVGKSSLFNALVREERVIVSPLPGTTRDAVDSSLTINGQTVLLIDTAGLKHRRKATSPLELFAMSRTWEAIARSDVVLLVIEATQAPTRQDRRIVASICESGRGLVLVVNKWDLVQRAQGARRLTARQLEESVRRSLPSASFAPVVAVCATTGFHVRQAFATAVQVARAMRRGLSNDDCVAAVRRAWSRQPPPRVRGRLVQFHHARWIAGRPPRLEVMTRPGQLPPPYARYLIKQLRAHPKLCGVPLHLSVKPCSN